MNRYELFVMLLFIYYMPKSILFFLIITGAWIVVGLIAKAINYAEACEAED